MTKDTPTPATPASTGPVRKTRSRSHRRTVAAGDTAPLLHQLADAVRARRGGS